MDHFALKSYLIGKGSVLTFSLSCFRCWVFLLALGSLCQQSYSLTQAVNTVNAEFLWQQGYTGSGVEIGVIDLHQADPSHPALNGNFLGSQNFVNGSGWLSFHATAVAGAAVSQDPNRRGVAYEAGWWTGQTTNRAGISPQQKASTVSAETFAQGLGILNGNPAEVITLSIGVGGSDTAVDQWSLALDHIVSTLGTTVVVAAGNDGPSSSSFSGPPSTAYNILSVGATGGTGAFVSEDYSQIAPFSSRGPTTDGRSKPDIVAPGSLLELPTLGGAWVETSGTSFAAPIVAGGAALLIDMGRTLGLDVDAKVIKSVLLNSADKLAGWSNSAIAPLDPNFGAGQMNLESAYYQYAAGKQGAGSVPAIGWDHAQLLGSTSKTYEIGGTVLGGSMISATLTWNREVATSVENIETAIYASSPLENLELFLFDQNDLLTPVANSMSPIDNVEHLFLAAPKTGNYVFKVRSASGNVVNPVSYSLAWNLTTTDALPGDFDLDGDVDGRDFLIWQGDPAVGDLSDWQANYGSAASLLVNSTAVPEPVSLGLLLGWLSLVTGKCWSRRVSLSAV